MIHADIMDVALGQRPADLVITNGVLMDVYTGRLVPERSLAAAGGRIVYIGPEAGPMIGPDTEVIEADGRVMAPGYIDAHAHLGNYWNFADFLNLAIPCGVTTYVTEVEGYGFGLGAPGLWAFLSQIEDRPVNCFGLIPPMVTRSEATKRFFITRDQARDLLAHPRIIGLGEPYWQAVVPLTDEHLRDLLEETTSAGKIVQGHAAGAKGARLAAYALAGAESCHESITPGELLERLEMGYYAMIRHGDIRQDVEIIRPLLDKVDLRRLILVTDGSNPELVRANGYLADVVQKAVDLGVPPIEAIRLVTLNPAENLGLQADVGGLAPGRRADVLLLPAADQVRPDLVMAGGKVLARQGAMVQPMTRVPYPPQVYETLRLTPITPQDLIVPAADGDGHKTVRTMDVDPGGLVTREGQATLRVQDGQCLADPDQDVLKIVFLERASGQSQKFVGFVRGWGLSGGALASSVTWDSIGVTAIGSDDVSLARAVNRVTELKGGSVACRHDQMLAEVPFPVIGYISDLPLTEVADRMEAFQQAAADLGCPLPYAHLTLNVMSATAIPFIKLTETGYYRFRENDIVGIF
jgi:adenine deaminase